MSKVHFCAMAMVTAAASLGCSDKAPSTPIEPKTEVPTGPVGTLVSNPMPISTGNNASKSSNSLGISAGTYAYASAAPGTFPAAVSAFVSNKTQNGTPQSLTVINGGFDPVAVTASAGDELSFMVLARDGAASTFTVKVPPRAPPQVIRTNPAKGRTDVALNVQIQIVFSEPVDRSTITPGSVTLSRSGVQVAATVFVSPDGLSVEVTPEVPLDTGTGYVLEVNQTILDLDGDALASPSTFDFTTLAALFPRYSGTGVIYQGDDSIYAFFDSYHGKLRSRYILEDNGTFRLQFSSLNYGFFEYPGKYSRTKLQITFEFEGWSSAGPWVALGDLSGATMRVRYNLVMNLSDFIDGDYVLVP